MTRGKREAKRTGLGRRLLSVFLAVVMCTSMLQLTVFAEGTDAPAGSGTPTTTSNIMDGAFVLTKDGIETNEDGTPKVESNTVTYPEGFTLTKFATQPEGYAENEFEVTLQVQTSQTTTTTLPVAAIQLVIDVSVTMDYCGTCNKTSCNQHASRMTELKNVLNGTQGFLNKLAADNVKASKIYVSVVTYGSGAKTVCDWEDIKTDAGLTAVKSAITNLRASDYATNIEAGLMLARNRLDMSKPASADVKYTVLLTDGQANCYVKKDVTSTSSISSSDCSSAAGADGTEDGKNAAAKMAAKVTPKSTLYGVGYGSENNNQDGIRPTSVTINLLADGVKINEAVVSEATGWAYAFDNLPRYADGVAIVYSITENAVDGYTPTYNGYNVTNTHASATVDITGTKTWDDGNDQDGIRPDSITIRLYADGTEVASKVVTAANGWAYTFEDMPGYANGVAIVYSITEDEVAGYTSSVTGYNVTNSHTPAVGTLILNKRGVGADVPKTAEFTVTGPHGYSKTVTYGEFNEGSYVIADIPVGVYTFTEDVATAQVKDYTLTAVGNGGSATVTAGAVAHVGITNKYEKIQTTGSLTIKKNFTGLDTVTENTLKNSLIFVVTNDKTGEETVVPYSESKGAMTLTDLTPGTYTVTEYTVDEAGDMTIGAEVGGGYDLTVKAYDADDSKDGYQVEVKASKNAATFYITNAYTSRIYNVWFSAGASYGTLMHDKDSN